MQAGIRSRKLPTLKVRLAAPLAAGYTRHSRHLVARVRGLADVGYLASCATILAKKPRRPIHLLTSTRYWEPNFERRRMARRLVTKWVPMALAMFPIRQASVRKLVECQLPDSARSTRQAKHHPQADHGLADLLARTWLGPHPHTSARHIAATCSVGGSKRSHWEQHIDRRHPGPGSIASAPDLAVTREGRLIHRKARGAAVHPNWGCRAEQRAIPDHYSVRVFHPNHQARYPSHRARPPVRHPSHQARTPARYPSHQERTPVRHPSHFVAAHSTPRGLDPDLAENRPTPDPSAVVAGPVTRQASDRLHSSTCAWMHHRIGRMRSSLHLIDHNGGS